MTDLEKILSLVKWTPLRNVVGAVDPSAFIDRCLYKLGDGLYLNVTSIKPGAPKDDPSAPYVVGVYCAPDDGAAKRAIVLMIEEDHGAVLNAPSAFLPPGASARYGSIRIALKKMAPKVFLETAGYRIAKDGAFVHRMIETERFAFFFRQPKYDDHEPPYAILRKLQ